MSVQEECKMKSESLGEREEEGKHLDHFQILAVK